MVAQAHCYCEDLLHDPFRNGQPMPFGKNWVILSNFPDLEVSQVALF